MGVIRRLLFVLAAGLALLLTILLIRTGLYPSRQIHVDPVPAIALDRQAAAERLAGALRFQTISRQNSSDTDKAAFLRFHDYLVRKFPKAHQALKREVVNGYSVIYTWAGQESGLAPILLLGHLDVVPVEPATERDWTHPPFSGAIADGYIWGRGVMDFKMAVVGTLEAIEALLSEGFTPRRTVLLAFGHDEEIGGQDGAEQIAAMLGQRGERPEMILDEGMAIVLGLVPGINSPVACIGIAEKGYVSLELLAQAEGGHSSMPPRHTAVGILSSAIHRLEAQPMPAHLGGPVGKMFEFLGPEMPLGLRLVFGNLWLFGSLLQMQLEQTPPTQALIRTTIAPTMFEGSIKENVLPARARAIVNVRIHPSDRIEDVITHVQKTIADPRVTIQRLPGTVSEPSPESPVEVSAFGLLQRTIAQLFPDAIVAPGLVLGATDSRHYRILSPNIYRFMPIRITREDTVRIHGTNERLTIEDYGNAVAFYARLIRNSDRL
ncbi:MAG: M20 family peptidase [Nitrospiraceae bacterium]